MIPNDEHATSSLIDFIYDDEALQYLTAKSLPKKASVCPKNETIDEINNIVLSRINASPRIYLSTDIVTPTIKNNNDIDLLYPNEYLNMLHFSGLPPHRLTIKVGAPVILLHNINQNLGLYNGTGLILTQLLSRVIKAQIITGTTVGTKVFIPKLCLTYTEKELSFVFKRKQFPVIGCYAMTINKSHEPQLQILSGYCQLETYVRTQT